MYLISLQEYDCVQNKYSFNKIRSNPLCERVMVGLPVGYFSTCQFESGDRLSFLIKSYMSISRLE